MPTDHVTCPYGHTFPTTQLTVRAGQYVCPVCDGPRWAVPVGRRPWSRSLLLAPLVVIALAVLLEVGVQVTTIGLGSTYQDQHLGGSGWLIFDGVLSLVGIVLIVGGVVALARLMTAPDWTRQRMAVPLAVIGAGLALNGIAGLFGLGFNVALLNVSSPGASWQFAGQLLDSVSQLALGLVGLWIAVLFKSSSDTQPSSASQTSPPTPDGLSMATGTPPPSGSPPPPANPQLAGGPSPVSGPSPPLDPHLSAVHRPPPGHPQPLDHP